MATSEAGEGGTPTGRRALGLLALGVAAGLAAAGYGLVTTDPSAGGLPDGVVARVDGAQIYADELARLVEGLESDTKEATTPERRRRLLDRMIEEELLVQRGLELGLAENDRRVRAEITGAMIRSIVVEAEDTVPSSAELRTFYAENADFFTQPPRLRVHQLVVGVPDLASDEAARQRARDARARLEAGETLEAVTAALGASPVSPLPDVLLPPAKLREYVGPTVLRAALTLPVGVWSEPVRSGTGYHVLRVVERSSAATPPFGEVAEQVRAEWMRRAGDRALRAYLDELRGRADVVIAPELQ